MKRYFGIVCVMTGILLLLIIMARPFLPSDSTNAINKNEFRCQAMVVPDGYGYVVTQGEAGDTLIVQPFIPTVDGFVPFATQQKALAVGRLVCRKLARGEAPTVSREEVRAMDH